MFAAIANLLLCICVAAIGADSLTRHRHHVHHEHREHHDHGWFRSESLDGNGLYVLDWKVVNKDIVFRVTANTRGYIGLGFSHKSERVSESDIALAWIDDRTGEATVLVSVPVSIDLCFTM